MTATTLDGKAILGTIKEELRQRVAALAEHGVVPGLGTVLVGDDPGSQWYVGAKHRDCAEIGIRSMRRDLPAGTSLDEVLAVVRELNDDPQCTGFIVQQPTGLDENAILSAVDPAKDVDGLHPTNLGWLVLGHPAPLPCTPVGCIELLRRYDVPIAGAKVVVVGRGITVGRPLGLILTRKSENATVTLCHTGTRDLAAEVRQADIVVAAAGVPGIITADMVKPGAAVLDVGVSRVVDEATGKSVVAGDVAPGRLGRRRLRQPQPRRGRPDDPGDAAVQRGRGRRTVARRVAGRRRGLSMATTSRTTTLVWRVLPVVALLALVATWGRDIGIPVVVLVALLLAGAVLAAVQHAEVVAHRVGEPFGSLVLAVAVTVIEVSLIVTLMLSGGDEAATLARETVFAAVMITINGILGLSLLLGARRFGTVRFNAEGTGGMLATVATLATVCLVLPTVTESQPGPEFTSGQLAFAAVASLALYLAFVVTQTVRHRDFFLPVAPDGEPARRGRARRPAVVPRRLGVARLPAAVARRGGRAGEDRVAGDRGGRARGGPAGLVRRCRHRAARAAARDPGGGQRGAPRAGADLAEPRDGLGDGQHRPDHPDPGRRVDLDPDAAAPRPRRDPDRAAGHHRGRGGADRRAGAGDPAAGQRAPHALRGVPLPRDVPLTDCTHDGCRPLW